MPRIRYELTIVINKH